MLLRELYWRTAEELSGGLSSAGARDPRCRGHGGAPPRAGRLGRGGDRASFRPRPRGLLAGLRRPGAGPPGAAGAPGRGGGARRSPSRPGSIRRAASTEVTVYAADRLGLFSDLAGAFALAGADIVDARIFTLTNGKALDSFTIQDAGGAFERPDKLARLAATIEHVIVDSPARTPGDIAIPPPALPSRAELFPVVPRVLIDNRASAAFTVIEVNGRDRKRPAAPPDPRARRPQAADRQRQDLDLRRARRRRVLRQGPVRPEDRR